MLTYFSLVFPQASLRYQNTLMEHVGYPTILQYQLISSTSCKDIIVKR